MDVQHHMIYRVPDLFNSTILKIESAPLWIQVQHKLAEEWYSSFTNLVVKVVIHMNKYYKSLYDYSEIQDGCKLSKGFLTLHTWSDSHHLRAARACTERLTQFNKMTDTVHHNAFSKFAACPPIREEKMTVTITCNPRYTSWNMTPIKCVRR